MESNRIIQFLKLPLGVKPLESKIQYTPDSTKRPLEVAKKLIKAAQKECLKARLHNKMMAEFWNDEFDLPDLIMDKQTEEILNVFKVR